MVKGNAAFRWSYAKRRSTTAAFTVARGAPNTKATSNMVQNTWERYRRGLTTDIASICVHKKSQTFAKEQKKRIAVKPTYTRYESRPFSTTRLMKGTIKTLAVYASYQIVERDSRCN